ncbi:CynX/NimT family MFS transporter [Bacillus tuaregi]|uniref:CynX/NimT family MFS transporter n=1 Tax=Bacillus tuaregi TaxID=1816695 RepID=UPI0008F91D34|nr:MFS transporter [Bacillus tuaregi]
MEAVNQMKKETKATARPRAAWLILVGIIFIAINLRAPLTSVGPLVDSIRDHLYISNTLAGMITTVPLLAFAFFSPFVPKLARRFGAEGVLLVAIIFLTIGIGLRSVSGVATLYIGTAVLGLAIAAGNVLLPSLIKREFPEKMGIMTGVYSISMNLFGAIASGISVPVALGLGFGWQGALGMWAILSFVSILFWLPQIKRRSDVARASMAHQAAEKPVNLWRSPLAWKVTLFMGLQSMVFYVLVTWLPELLKQQGMTAGQAGWMLSIMQMTVLPVTFIAPIIAGRMTNQRILVVITACCLFIGNIGLLYGSYQLTLMWIIFLGIGAGLSFGLAMIFFGLRTRNAQQAAELSGMAQAFGYLLASTGPTLFGYLHDVTNSWTTPLLLLVGASILILFVGMGAGKNQYVGEGE